MTGKLGLKCSAGLHSGKIFCFFVDLSGAHKFSMSNGRLDGGALVSFTSWSSRAISRSPLCPTEKKQECVKFTCAFLSCHVLDMINLQSVYWNGRNLVAYSLHKTISFYVQAQK